MRAHQHYYFNYDNVFFTNRLYEFCSASVKAVMITLGNHDFACEILAIGSRFSTKRFRDFIPHK